MSDPKTPKRCRHGNTFSALRPCEACSDDPGPALTTVDDLYQPPEPPDGCVDTLAHERRLVAIAELAEAKARELLAGEARIGFATANQLVLSAVRARIAASTLAGKREQKDYMLFLLANERDMAGVGRRNR